MRGLLGVALATLVLGVAICAPRCFDGHVAPSPHRVADEVELTFQGILQSSDGQCAVLLAPASGEPVLPIFIQPFEAAALIEEIRSPDERQRPASDRLALALIDALGGRLEKMRIETPEPLKSRGSLFLRGPSGESVLPAPGFLVLSLALFTAIPLTIDRGGLDAWGMSRRDFESLIGSLERAGEEASAPGDSPSSVDL